MGSDKKWTVWIRKGKRSVVECHCYRLDKNDYALAPSCSLSWQVTLQVAHQKLFIDHSSIRHIHNTNSNPIRGYARAVAFLKAGRHNHAPLLSVDTVHLPPALSLSCSLYHHFTTQCMSVRLSVTISLNLSTHVEDIIGTQLSVLYGEFTQIWR